MPSPLQRREVFYSSAGQLRLVVGNGEGRGCIVRVTLLMRCLVVRMKNRDGVVQWRGGECRKKREQEKRKKILISFTSVCVGGWGYVCGSKWVWGVGGGDVCRSEDNNRKKERKKIKNSRGKEGQSTPWLLRPATTTTNDSTTSISTTSTAASTVLYLSRVEPFTEFRKGISVGRNLCFSEELNRSGNCIGMLFVSASREAAPFLSLFLRLLLVFRHQPRQK